MNNHQQISSEASVLNQALAIAQQSLSSFFDNLSDGSVAFGNNYNQILAQELFQAFAQGNFTAVPTIKILSEEVLGSTNGAYTKQKNEIYLNEIFLSENVGNAKAIADVIIEEIGHFIDAQINTTDSAGDEGEIFARLVNGETLNSGILANLKAEYDSKTIVLGGELVEIEQNTIEGVTIYQHGSYSGISQTLQAGNYDVNSLTIGNDQLSSLKVDPGFAAILYEHANFAGQSVTYTANTSWVGTFNDLTSSIRVIKPLQVTNNNDSGIGSLRYAIDYANSNPGIDTIDLTGISGTINLNSTLNIGAGNDINFVDDGNTIISGQNARQIFSISGANVSLSRLTLANGYAKGGDGFNGGGGGLGAGGRCSLIQETSLSITLLLPITEPLGEMVANLHKMVVILALMVPMVATVAD
jgi:hypothetical protein